MYELVIVVCICVASILCMTLWSWAYSPPARLLQDSAIPSQTAEIPKNIYLTSHLPCEVIPDLVTRHANAYSIHLFDDSSARELLAAHFTDTVLEKYDALKGAHRADLWRYCVLYLNGGIYLDIKSIPMIDLDLIFMNKQILNKYMYKYKYKYTI